MVFEAEVQIEGCAKLRARAYPHMSALRSRCPQITTKSSGAREDAVIIHPSDV